MHWRRHARQQVRPDQQDEFCHVFVAQRPRQDSAAVIGRRVVEQLGCASDGRESQHQLRDRRLGASGLQLVVRRTKAVVVLAGVGCILALAGCGGDAGGSSPTPASWGYGPALEALAQQATEAGSSDEQLAVLTRWGEIHDTPYADLADAAQRLFECFESAGLAYTYAPPGGGDDYPEFQYLVSDDPDIDDDSEYAMMSQCEDREINFVSLAYQMGPGVTARRERDDAAFFPEAVACLERRGVVVDSSISTVAELDAFLDEGDLSEHGSCTIPPYARVG